MAGGRADLLGVGARAFPPVGAVRRRRRRHARMQFPHRVRVDLARTAAGCSPRTWRTTTARAGGCTQPPDLAGGRARGVRAVPRAGAGRGHPQRAAAGRLGPRHPGPLGDRHPPRLERSATSGPGSSPRVPREFFAAVRAEAGVRRLGGLDQPADQGHEPGVHRQGRLLHRHQAGAARGRDRGHRRRTARPPSPGWPARRTRTRRWTRPGGCWPTAPTTTPSPGPSPTRCTWTCWAAGGRPASSACGRPRRRHRPAWRPADPAGRGRAGRSPSSTRLSRPRGRRWPGSRSARPGDMDRLELRDDAGEPVPCAGRGGPAAARRLAGRGDPDVPGPGRAGARATRTLPAAGRGHRRGRLAGGRRDGDRERRVPGRPRIPARGGTVSVTDKRTGACVLTGPRQRAGHPGRVRAAPPARRGSLAPVAQGPGLGSASVPATVRAERCPSAPGWWPSFSLDGLRRDPGDDALGRRRTGRVPHPRGLLRRAGPSAAGAASRPTCRAGCRSTRPPRR